MRLKVLQLEPWMKRIHSGHGTPRDLKEFAVPFIGRNGWYLEAGVSWFELDGRAFTTPALRGQFLYKMRELDRAKVNRDHVRELKRLLAKLPTAYSTLRVRDLMALHHEFDLRGRLEMYKHKKRVLTYMAQLKKNKGIT